MERRAGFATASAEAGADVALGAPPFDRLGETKRIVEGMGRRGIAIQTDVVRRSDCQALVRATVEEFGRVAIVVNNAGFNAEAMAEHETEEHFRSIVDVNLHGSFWMAQSSARVMTPGSSIVNISSVLALRSAKMNVAAFSASKAGVLALTRDLAAQWASPKGIRVNAIAPGTFRTEATATMTEEYLARAIEPRILVGRLGEPEDAAAALLLLVSDAGSYVSLPVDGGALLD